MGHGWSVSLLKWGRSDRFSACTRDGRDCGKWLRVEELGVGEFCCGGEGGEISMRGHVWAVGISHQGHQGPPRGFGDLGV